MKLIKVEAFWSWETGLTHYRLAERLPYEDFRRLKNADLLYHIEWENEEEVPHGWYVFSDLERLHQLGYKFEDEIEKAILKERRNRRLSEQTADEAEALGLTCPGCGSKLSLGTFAPDWAVMHCYTCNYSAAVRKQGSSLRVERAGFDKEEAEKLKKELNLGGEPLNWALFFLRDYEEYKKLKAEQDKVIQEFKKFLDSLGGVEKWHFDWSFDDYRCRLGEEIKRHPKYVWIAYEYFCEDELVGFVIKGSWSSDTGLGYINLLECFRKGGETNAD